MKRLDASWRDITGLSGLYGPTDIITMSGKEWDALTVSSLRAALAASEARAAFLLRAIDDHRSQPWAGLYRAEYDRMIAEQAKGGRDGE